MGEKEGHNRWSRIRPSWVRRMAEEPKDAKGPGEAEKAPVPEKKLGEGEKKVETPGAVEGAVEGKEKVPPRLEDVERELEAEKEKTKKMEELLERQREGETSRVAEMAQRLAAETERQQKLARELQQQFSMPPVGMQQMAMHAPPMGWMGAAPGMVFNYGLPPQVALPHGVPHGVPVPAGSAGPPQVAQGCPAAQSCPVVQGCQAVPGCQAAQGCQVPQGPGGTPLTPSVMMPTPKGTAGVKGGVKGPEGPPGKVLVKAIPMQPEVVRTLEAKKGVAAAGSAATKPIEPKERPPVKEAAKKPPVEKPQVEKPKPPVFPVDDGYDEERERQDYMQEKWKYPRTTDGLTEAQRQQRVKGSEVASRKMASQATEAMKEGRYAETPGKGSGEGQGFDTTQSQLDRMERKVDWITQYLHAQNREKVKEPPAPPPSKSWDKKEVKQWLLEQWLSQNTWEAPSGKGELLREAIAEDKAKGSSRKRSHSLGARDTGKSGYAGGSTSYDGGYDGYGGSYSSSGYGYQSWQEEKQDEEDDDQTWGKKWK